MVLGDFGGSAGKATTLEVWITEAAWPCSTMRHRSMTTRMPCAGVGGFEVTIPADQGGQAEGEHLVDDAGNERGTRRR